jgi:hypothetical protein
MFLQMLRRALVLDLSTAFGKLMVPTRRNRRVDGGVRKQRQRRIYSTKETNALIDFGASVVMGGRNTDCLYF